MVVVAKKEWKKEKYLVLNVCVLLCLFVVITLKLCLAMKLSCQV